MIARSVLSVLLTREGWHKYGSLFDERFWSASTGQELFQTIQWFWEHSGEKIGSLDDSTLEALLDSRVPDKAAECLKYIRAANKIPAGKRSPLVQRALKDWSTRRELARLIQDLDKGAFDPADAAARMDNLATATNGASHQITPAHELILGDAIEEVASQKYPTGIKDIDHQLRGGLWAGEIGIAYAPSFRGKTWFLVHQGCEALRHKIPVQHHTFRTEVNARRARIRYYQNLCEIDRESLLHDPKKLSGALKRMKLPPWSLIEHEGFPTTGHIRQHVLRFMRQCKRRGIKKRPLIIVDYLGLVSPANRTVEGRFSYLARTRELRHIAATFDVALWTAHQTNRPTFRAQHIRMEDASECIGVTDTADVIITLNQTPVEEQLGIQRWIIDKARERDFLVTEWTVNAQKSVQRFSGKLSAAQKKAYYQ